MDFFAFTAPCSLWVDDQITLKKGRDEAAEPQPTARLVGIVSASGTDFQGENLDQDGLDWEYFQKSGWLNWEHQQGPEFIVGYPEPNGISKTKDKDGNQATRVVASILLHQPRGLAVYQTATALQKAGGSRQIGFSVEGEVTHRDPRNPKHVLRARVRNVAVTAHPQRTTARVEMVKSLDALATMVKSGVGYQEPAGVSTTDTLSPLLVQSIDKKVARAAKDFSLEDLQLLIKSRFPLLVPAALEKAAVDLKHYLNITT